MKVLITAPKYDPATSAHLITVDLEQQHTKHMHDEGYSIDFMLQPILPNVPYLSDEHMTVLKALAAKTYDHLVVIGKPGILRILDTLLPGKITVVCPAMTSFSYDDWRGKELLEQHNGSLYALNQATLDWAGRGELFKLDMSYLPAPEKKPWSCPLRIYNAMPASLTRMQSMGLKGVTLVTTKQLIEATKNAVPIDEGRGLTAVEEGSDGDAFVLDRSMSIVDILTFMSKGMYPVLGAQNDEGVLREIETAFGTKPLSVFEITETAPVEAEDMLSDVMDALKRHKEAGCKTTEAILLEAMK